MFYSIPQPLLNTIQGDTMKTIRELFNSYGLIDTKNSFHKTWKNGFVIIKCPQDIKNKCASHFNQWIASGKIQVIAKDRDGNNFDFFLGYQQQIQGFRGSGNTDNYAKQLGKMNRDALSTIPYH